MPAPVRTGNPLLRLQRGTYGTGGEVMDKTYYDTLVLVSGAVNYRMFSVPLGQGVPPKTQDLTNMISSGQIAQGQNLKVHEIVLQYITHAAIGTAAVQYIYDVLNHHTAEILVPGKDSLGDWTLAELMGDASLIALTPTAAGDNIPIMQGVFRGVKRLKVKLTLSALTTFEVRVTPHVASNAALNGDFIRLGLRGILKRSS